MQKNIWPVWMTFARHKPTKATVPKLLFMHLIKQPDSSLYAVTANLHHHTHLVSKHPKLHVTGRPFSSAKNLPTTHICLNQSCRTRFPARKCGATPSCFVAAWWQWLTSAWRSASSASSPARPSSSPCWHGILPGNAPPGTTQSHWGSRGDVTEEYRQEPLW